MHLLFVLFDFTIVFCFAWDDYVASFCNSPIYFFTRGFPLSHRYAMPAPPKGELFATYRSVITKLPLRGSWRTNVSLRGFRRRSATVSAGNERCNCRLPLRPLP